MDLKQSKKLGMNVVLFGVGFTLGYYIYTGLFKQTVSFPSVPPSLGKVPGLKRMVSTPPPAPVEEPVAPPTPLEMAQANPDAVTNALLFYIND